MTRGWSEIGSSPSGRKPASASSRISQCSPRDDVAHLAGRVVGAAQHRGPRRRIGAATGTGVAPASVTSCGSRPQPGQTISTSSRRRDGAQRGPQQLAGAVADHHARADRRRGAAAIASRSGVDVRVGVDRPPQRERRGVDHLRVRRTVPGGAREVQRRLLRRMAAALVVAALEQLARDLVRGELVELPVVAEEAPHQRDEIEGAGPSISEEPDPEDDERDHRGGAEDPRQRALALLVPGGAAHDPPRAVQPRRERQRHHQRGEDADEGDDDARACASRARSRPASRPTATPAAAAPRPTGRAASRARAAPRRARASARCRRRAATLRDRRGSAPARCPGGDR